MTPRVGLLVPLLLSAVFSLARAAHGQAETEERVSLVGRVVEAGVALGGETSATVLRLDSGASIELEWPGDPEAGRAYVGLTITAHGQFGVRRGVETGDRKVLIVDEVRVSRGQEVRLAGRLHRDDGGRWSLTDEHGRVHLVDSPAWGRRAPAIAAFLRDEEVWVQGLLTFVFEVQQLERAPASRPHADPDPEHADSKGGEAGEERLVRRTGRLLRSDTDRGFVLRVGKETRVDLALQGEVSRHAVEALGEHVMVAGTERPVVRASRVGVGESQLMVGTLVPKRSALDVWGGRVLPVGKASIERLGFAPEDAPVNVVVLALEGEGGALTIQKSRTLP